MPTVVGLAVLIAAVIGFFKLKKALKKLFRRGELRGLDRKGIAKKWEEVELLIQQGSETSSKLAVIEADKLIDHVLRHMGFSGSSLGERLRVASYKFEKLRRVWWPHKIRNQVVHQADFRIDLRTAKKAVKEYGAALEELGVL